MKSPSCITGIRPVGLSVAQFGGGLNGITGISTRCIDILQDRGDDRLAGVNRNRNAVNRNHVFLLVLPPPQTGKRVALPETRHAFRVG